MALIVTKETVIKFNIHKIINKQLKSNKRVTLCSFFSDTDLFGQTNSCEKKIGIDNFILYTNKC